MEVKFRPTPAAPVDNEWEAAEPNAYNNGFSNEPVDPIVTKLLVAFAKLAEICADVTWSAPPNNNVDPSQDNAGLADPPR